MMGILSKQANIIGVRWFAYVKKERKTRFNKNFNKAIYSLLFIYF